MEPFTKFTGVAVPLIRDNVDTDAIIPSREMKTVSKSGLADGLFAGWRYAAVGSCKQRPDFILNDPSYVGARILLTGANFGCGSSREHAVWALKEFGFRAIIASSFNPIFRGNCVANGVLPITIEPARISEIAESIVGHPDHLLTIDLSEEQIASPDGSVWRFSTDQVTRHALLHGLDPVEQTLQFSQRIEAFRADDARERPWIYSSVSRAP